MEFKENYLGLAEFFQALFDRFFQIRKKNHEFDLEANSIHIWSILRTHSNPLLDTNKMIFNKGGLFASFKKLKSQILNYLIKRVCHASIIGF